MNCQMHRVTSLIKPKEVNVSQLQGGLASLHPGLYQIQHINGRFSGEGLVHTGRLPGQ